MVSNSSFNFLFRFYGTDFYGTDSTRLWVNYIVSNLSNLLRVEHRIAKNTFMDESCKGSTRQRVSRLARFSNITNTQSYNTNGNREKREINWKVYSPPCAAITSCSTRGVCSPVDCIHRLEYASWGQATICQIKPIASC